MIDENLTDKEFTEIIEGFFFGEDIVCVEVNYNKDSDNNDDKKGDFKRCLYS